jgi:PAS domain S-box-containing protein
MFRKFKNSIVGKIMLGYAVIICLAFITTLTSMYTAWQNRRIDKLVSEAYYPMVLSLKETEMLASESYKLINNWIYQPNVQEKEKLKLLQSKDVAVQKDALLKITDLLDNKAAVEEARAIVTMLDALVTEQQSVMDKLSNEKSYSDDLIVDEAITAMEKKITPAYHMLREQITKATDHQNKFLDDAKDQKESSSNMLSYLYISNIILFVLIGVYASYFSINYITKPIAGLSDLITMLSRGKFISVTQKKGDDEIGRMAGAIENMLTGLKAKVEFAENIGKGNYESNFELLSADDTMGSALIQMRDNLKQAADDDRKRNWATEGLAKFADILRSGNDNLSELSDNIIGHLVKYMGASQGALFLINDDNLQDTFIELVACYAYNRKKYLNKRIELGEGVAGQCILEKDTVYMSDIPNDYLRITSGLGEALPKNLLVVPLKLNENIFGVVEIASFQTIDSHQIEFVQKLGESIASTISSVKVNGRTKKLLEETQVQAEQMRAQEEEMRQNMEELSATQEEMHRAQRRSEEALQEMKGKEEHLFQIKYELETREQAFSLSSLLSETDSFGNITYANARFCEVSKFLPEELIGKPHSMLRHEDMPKELFKHLWQTIKRGEVFKGVIKNRAKDGSSHWVRITIMPVRNERKEIVKYIGASYSVEDGDLAIRLYNRQAEMMKLPFLQEELLAEPVQ